MQWKTGFAAEVQDTSQKKKKWGTFQGQTEFRWWYVNSGYKRMDLCSTTSRYKSTENNHQGKPIILIMCLDGSGVCEVTE